MALKNNNIFPQANNLNTVFLIFKMAISGTTLNAKEVAKKIRFSERQGNYYLTALKFIGFINNDYKLDEKFLFLKNLSEKRLIVTFASEIINKPIFKEVFINYFIYDDLLSTETIAQMIRKEYFLNNESVNFRRAQTVISWIKSIISKSFYWAKKLSLKYYML